MIESYFDGACALVNPGGIGSYGFIIYINRTLIYQESKIISSDGKVLSRYDSSCPIVSNNVSEYIGCLNLLKCLLERNLDEEEIIVYGDSNLVINQMNNIWKIKKGFYFNVASECKKIISKFKNLKFLWIPRERNVLADSLSKTWTKK